MATSTSAKVLHRPWGCGARLSQCAPGERPGD